MTDTPNKPYSERAKDLYQKGKGIVYAPLSVIGRIFGDLSEGTLWLVKKTQEMSQWRNEYYEEAKLTTHADVETQAEIKNYALGKMQREAYLRCAEQIRSDPLIITKLNTEKDTLERLGTARTPLQEERLNELRGQILFYKECEALKPDQEEKFKVECELLEREIQIRQGLSPTMSLLKMKLGATLQANSILCGNLERLLTG